MHSTSDICVKIYVTGSGSTYLLDVHAPVVKVTSADGVSVSEKYPLSRSNTYLHQDRDTDWAMSQGQWCSPPQAL